MLFRSDRKSTRLNSSHTLISYALPIRSEEHTSELQSHSHLVCRLLLEKKKKSQTITDHPTPTAMHAIGPRRARRRICWDTGVTAAVSLRVAVVLSFFFFFFFNDTATTEIYTSFPTRRSSDLHGDHHRRVPARAARLRPGREPGVGARSEEHTSELQSHSHLVCRLLLEKK